MRHSVWGFGAPPVQSNLWTQEGWQRFEDKFRPADYTGDRYDEAAWAEYVAAKRREYLRSELAKYGITLMPDGSRVGRDETVLCGPNDRDAAVDWLRANGV